MSAPSYILAIDQGTTSTRAVLVGNDGPAAWARADHRQILPQPGWVEHDPVEIHHRTLEVIAQVLRSAGPGQIAAVGIANQRETTIVWSKSTGRPLCNAIVWQDTRTRDMCDQLSAGAGQDRFRAATGLPIATYFSATKLRWILDNVPEARAAADRGDALFGTIDSWLVWQLTGGRAGGVHITDVTNASRTMLMNLRTLDWDRDILGALQIPRAMLPRIVCSADPAGYGPVRGVEGLEGAQICAILGDQQAALVGQGCLDTGQSKNTYGTGCFLLLNTGTQIVASQSGLLTTVAYQWTGSPAVYALEGSVAVAGALIQWLRDNLSLIAAAGDVEALARSVPDNGGVYLVPAFSGLFAPYWRSDARGILAGMTRFTNKGHIARAALEATAYQTRDVLEAMHKDAGARTAVLKADGGMSANDLLMQFQADILGVDVVCPADAEATALGAARAAAMAVGLVIDGPSQPPRTFHPRMDKDERERLYTGWKMAVERSLNWAT